VIKLRVEIASHRDNYQNLQSAQQAFDRGDYNTVVTLCEPLKASLPRAKELWTEAQCYLLYKRAEDNYEAGDLANATLLLEQITGLGTSTMLVVVKARQLSESIKTKQNDDEDVQKTLQAVAQLRQRQDLESWREAYRKLIYLVGQPSTLKERITREFDNLKHDLIEKSRQQMRANYQANKLDIAWEYAAFLREISGDIEVKEISKIGQAYYTSEAERHNLNGNPDDALRAYEEAKNLAVDNRSDLQIKIGRLHLVLAQRKVAEVNRSEYELDPTGRDLEEALYQHDLAMASYQQILEQTPHHHAATQLQKEVTILGRQIESTHLLNSVAQRLENWRTDKDLQDIKESLSKIQTLDGKSVRLRQFNTLVEELQAKITQALEQLEALKKSFDEERLNDTGRYAAALKQMSEEMPKFIDGRIYWFDPTDSEKHIKGLKDVMEWNKLKRDNLATWTEWQRQLESRKITLQEKYQDSIKLSNPTSSLSQANVEMLLKKLGSSLAGTGGPCITMWSVARQSLGAVVEEVQNLISDLKKGPAGISSTLTKSAQQIQTQTHAEIKTWQDFIKKVEAEIADCYQRQDKFEQLKKQVEGALRDKRWDFAQESILKAQELCPFDNAFSLWRRLIDEGKKTSGGWTLFGGKK